MWSRRSTWARYASVGASGNSTSKHPSLELARDLEPGVLEDTEHGVVLGQHLRDEALDPVPGSHARELLQKACSDSAALEVVRDREGHLRHGRVPEAGVGRDGDDALGVAGIDGSHQSAAFFPVGLGPRLDERRSEGRHPVEAEVQALGGQALDELQHCGGVGLARRTEPERAPVSQDDVGDLRVGDHRDPSCRHLGRSAT